MDRPIVPASPGSNLGVCLASSSDSLDLVFPLLPMAPPITRDPMGELPCLQAAGTITVFHPEITPPRPFLVLTVYPTSPEPGSPSGVLFNLVSDACTVLANNASGYLTPYYSPTPVTPEGGLLLAGNYMFHVDSIGTRTSPYPLCSEFKSWQPVYPVHQRWTMPGMTRDVSFSTGTSWSVISTSVRIRDRRCAITGASSRLEASHMVPQAERHWFAYHSIALRADDRSNNINSVNNLISLRADLNGPGFNNGHFIIYPYNGALITTSLTDGAPDLAYELHFRQVILPPRIRAEYLYIRFAWSVFKIAQNLLDIFINFPGAVSISIPQKLHQFIAQSKAAKQQKPDAGRSGQSGQSGLGIQQGGGGATDDRGAQRDVDGDVDSSHDDDDSQVHTDQDSQWLDIYQLDERYIAALEAVDADIQRHPDNTELAADAERKGWYPGFSRAVRLAHEYRLGHPEVSAVGSARIAHVWEDDEEPI
ncbi:hypothetical protein B0H11DRAFT_2055790 [Mycena galericulata]|nr:hypothetical protein B0H11DRAFT_2055790 [Mycena galericulata]